MKGWKWFPEDPAAGRECPNPASAVPFWKRSRRAELSDGGTIGNNFPSRMAFFPGLGVISEPGPVSGPWHAACPVRRAEAAWSLAQPFSPIETVET